MKKRKVLFVVHQLNHGGVQKALISALNAIDYTENEVTLYVRKNRIQLLSDVNENVHQITVNEDKTHYYRKPYALVLLFMIQICGILKLKNKSENIQKRLVDFINKSQMNYEQTHYFRNQEEYDVAISYIQGYTAKFVAQYVNAKKKVMFFHGSTDETHELHEEIMPYLDLIVGVNEGVQNVLEELYPNHAHKVTFLENYVDEEDVRKKSKAFKVEHPEEKMILCSCGRITPVKGFDLAVETARILKEKNLDFFWYFVGDGPEREYIETLIKKYMLEGYIKITGMQDNPYPYIDACDIYVQPSYEEAHPLAIIEAHIICKPVISTPTVGGKALIENSINGLLTEFSVESLAGSILLLGKDKEKYQNICYTLKTHKWFEEFKKYKNKWKKLLEEN